MKVLVAEDDSTTRLLLVKTVQRWGHEVVGAADGEAAWELIKEGGFRLLITDWEMPRLDGLDLCKRIRGRGAREYTYVLVLTSHKESDHIVRGLEAGADDFVSKPFNPAELKARLGVGLRMIALQDGLESKFHELERANAQLAQIAATDPLTGLGNRRSFEEEIRLCHARSAVDAEPYGVAMIDIDQFKKFNDRYGHLVGDRVLQAVAREISAAAAPGVRVFRYGGEEIVVLSPASSAEQLGALAEGMRSRVAGIRLAQEGEAVSVTASFGVAIYERSRDRAFESVVSRADEALYASKAAGRNRVTAA
jgi:diguanylate cyclase (GGDEF)-like protein